MMQKKLSLLLLLLAPLFSSLSGAPLSSPKSGAPLSSPLGGKASAQKASNVGGKASAQKASNVGGSPCAQKASPTGGGLVGALSLEGNLTVRTVARNAVRIRYASSDTPNALPALPDWLYEHRDAEEVETDEIGVEIDKESGEVRVKNKAGETVFVATRHELENGVATLAIKSPQDEHLFGLGQFQDGYSDLRGLSRRLTQVNTQISIPMMLSSKGYGLLWNNYGLTDFNPLPLHVELARQQQDGDSEVVHVTSTEGDRQEVRQRNLFSATLHVAESGDYALLLDVGQKMARRHHLAIDGTTVIDMQNVWLPPTASTIVHLDRGEHRLSAELADGDQPVLYYGPTTDETVFRSPVADAVDYTVFVGTADEIVSSYRRLTGEAPLMPRWALGYIHCRERFHSQDEILQTANRFQSERLPVSVLVQDWQYWGKHGWNSMQFDEDHYPNPRLLTDSLHSMGMRLMVSVWSKIDRHSQVGQQMERDGHYIPGTDWIDFFSPTAAAAYWKNFSQRLVPLGIDAWWQDATEPENDDLVGRRVNNGQWDGAWVRNVYPLLVNKTVYEGLLGLDGARRPMILTRCGFPGIQRYGSALWSGDVGNDWETLRRQLTAGLGMQAAGVPWWTYDAGGFFRPADQYTNRDYIQRMLRWIETSVYLPLMRVHGYMSNTEPWNYGAEAQSVIADCLKERYRLLPYIYSQAAAVSFEGGTLMRPLVFDFAADNEALRQKHTYMFGPSLLVSPITEPDVKTWKTYLPENAGGWYDCRHGNRHFDGGQYVETQTDERCIPLFARAGSLLLLSEDAQPESPKAKGQSADRMVVRVFPGADARFTLYEDDGTSRSYEQGECVRIPFAWNDRRRTLIIGKRQGACPGMSEKRTFRVEWPDGSFREIEYKGKEVRIQL